MNDLKGRIPTTSTDLQKELPGVGRYTAGIEHLLLPLIIAKNYC